MQVEERSALLAASGDKLANRGARASLLAHQGISEEELLRVLGSKSFSKDAGPKWDHTLEICLSTAMPAELQAGMFSVLEARGVELPEAGEGSDEGHDPETGVEGSGSSAQAAEGGSSASGSGQVRLRSWADCSRLWDLELGAWLQYRLDVLRYITSWTAAEKPEKSKLARVRLNPFFFPTARREFCELKIDRA